MNGLHRFNFYVDADVQPIRLKPNVEEMVFRFPDDSMEPFVTQTLTLTNPGNAPADFKLHALCETFSVSPTTGTVDAESEFEIDVAFCPRPGLPLEGELKLVVANGKGETENVQCIGEVDEAICQFHDKKLSFGRVAVGLVEERECQLINTGQNPAVFWIEGVPEGFSVFPQRSRLAPKESIDLRVTLKPPAASEYAGAALRVCVRGGGILALPINAIAEIPAVEVEEDEIDFGECTIGALSHHPISIKNGSLIPAILILDLGQHKEYSVRISHQMADDEGIENLMVPVTDTRMTSRGTSRSRGSNMTGKTGQAN